MKSLIFAAAVAAVIFCGEARAAETDFSTVLRTEEGKPFTDCVKFEATPTTPGAPPKCEQMADVTLSMLARAALNIPEQGIANDEIIRRGMLARAIFKQPKQNLSADDIKLIKDALAKRGYSPVLLLAAFELLDPASVKPRP